MELIRVTVQDHETRLLEMEGNLSEVKNALLGTMEKPGGALKTIEQDHETLLLVKKTMDRWTLNIAKLSGAVALGLAIGRYLLR